jgi:predicted Zn-dependent protease
LDVLTDDEVRAAIAHELGHVWVFTHHPFLQTEELANRIAMRAVSRETLERVYDKVWKRIGTKGDVALFFGDEPTAALASESQPH